MNSRILSLCFLGLLIAVSSRAATPPFFIVTDLDDTIKITHSAKPLPAAWNGLFTAKAFAGMSELYRGLLASQAATPDEAGLIQNLFVISGTPTFLKFRVRHFLEKNHYPPASIALKPIRENDIYRFKVSRLESLASDTSEPFLLLGDDVAKDPESYETFLNEAPARVLKIYVHRVTGREIPASATPYYTAYEVAYAEARAGRLAVEDATAVAEAILNTRRDSRIIPGFAVCPHVEPMAEDGSSLDHYRTLVNERVHSICQKREEMKQRRPHAPDHGHEHALAS